MRKQELAAYSYAASLLCKREYCTVEIKRKLTGRDYEAEVISFAIRQLKQDGYLSDERYAEAYLRSRLDKGEAPWLAAQRARFKGADEACVETALEVLTENYDADEVARELLSNRDPAGLRFEDERVWQRQARFLQNKGFGSDIILRILKEK